MDRRFFLTVLGGAVATASGAFAAAFADVVVDQLRAQGYETLVIERTLLGRVRILAQKAGKTREIILNPRTGEILRDVLTDASGEVVPQIASSGGSGSSGSLGMKPSTNPCCA